MTQLGSTSVTAIWGEGGLNQANYGGSTASQGRKHIILSGLRVLSFLRRLARNRKQGLHLQAVALSLALGT